MKACLGQRYKTFINTRIWLRKGREGKTMKVEFSFSLDLGTATYKIGDYGLCIEDVKSVKMPYTY
jgi:hypothetical protein